MDSRPLLGRVALVTGSSRRIGREIVLTLARAGADVIVHGHSNASAAEAVRREVEALGVKATVALCDVSDHTAVGKMIEAAVRDHGRLDVLVNNAAVRRRRGLAEITVAEWREVVGVILDGAFNCAQAAAPHLARGGVGRIINIGGDSAFTGAREHAHVIAAKAGLQGLTRALAADLAAQAVAVNMISPGYIEAREDDPKRTAERRQHYALDRIPLGHPGAPADIAAVVTALAGDGFGYVTGQTLHVNGGFLMA
ncbi:MAG: 3-oxoacyl-[acyl-carrier protein] reductase [Alphaproteobacteria bacterium]|jgi:3-oxoacyl-[acyl-carrier protein] reductase|nr:3-oxoacyl-[acyl-carrier protein] reductase [Alphaproteobacteria bacterium]